MNKLVIFDLDGVLIESRELHYNALNAALEKVGPQYVITKEEHLSVFDGLNTTKKLELLSVEKGLPKKYFNQVWEDKQKFTFDLIKNIKNDIKLIDIFKNLKNRNFNIGTFSDPINLESIKRNNK